MVVQQRMCLHAHTSSMDTELWYEYSIQNNCSYACIHIISYSQVGLLHLTEIVSTFSSLMCCIGQIKLHTISFLTQIHKEPGSVGDYKWRLYIHTCCPLQKLYRYLNHTCAITVHIHNILYMYIREIEVGTMNVIQVAKMA
jgi:hypothetical protein